ncbi:MarR family winged helix-turn-helix transcriptional regulator [Actinomadura sp. HBU206391]|uniref:MarR family winged helix-turn-helix transcriptional regulator n=1 Tax=Actinomadura sp. HBU206391 TaxID=2731692 RepID=UPI00164F4005|nr:MarR family transcriptional regulator [Actinomadura sp. HBU206391]MBC6459143.1 MarR family transcriptional regulator [Actinomadura sp. HBU206391]
MSRPRWLNDDEQGAWRAFYAASRVLFDQLDRELQRDSDMPHTYYEILVVLSEVPERELRMRELAELTRSSPSRLSHAVSRLEGRGWVRRRECLDDKRGQFAMLTGEGMAALVEAAPGHVEGVRTHLFDRLTPQQVDQLRAICEAVVDPLVPDHPLLRRQGAGTSGERKEGP